MSFEIESLEKLGSKPYIGSVVVVILIALPLFAYIWSEFKEISREKISVFEKTQELESEKSSFEKNRADFEIAVAQKNAEIEKREFKVEQMQKRIDEVISELEKRSLYTENLSKELLLSKELNSKMSESKAAEEKLITLMSEFSALGVNLNKSFPCGDKDAEKNYNIAKSKYSEIYALAEAKGIYSKYSTFFYRNSPMTSSQCYH